MRLLLVVFMAFLASSNSESVPLRSSSSSSSTSFSRRKGSVETTLYKIRPSYPSKGNSELDDKIYFDEDGYEVEAKARVAFTATRANSYTLHAPATVRFEKTVHDIGYGWLAREGVFQAYYPGTYVFSWSGVSPSNSQVRLTLVKNNEEIAHAWGEEHGYQSASNTVTLNLRPKDRVAVKITEGSLFEPTNSARGYTTFSGFRLN